MMMKRKIALRNYFGKLPTYLKYNSKKGGFSIYYNIVKENR